MFAARYSHFASCQSLFVALSAVLLASCADFRAPEYKGLDTPEKSSWSEPRAAHVSAAETITPNWWEEFGDPYLDGLVTKAIAERPHHLAHCCQEIEPVRGHLPEQIEPGSRPVFLATAVLQRVPGAEQGLEMTMDARPRHAEPGGDFADAHRSARPGECLEDL